MNPVFASKLDIGTNGQVYLVAGNTIVPGALPRTSNPSVTPAVTPQAPPTSQPVVMASEPQARRRRRRSPATAANLDRRTVSAIYLAGRSEAQSSASGRPARHQYRNGREAKTRRSGAHRLHSSRAASQPQEAAPPKPHTVANNAPAPATARAEARDDQNAPDRPSPEMRTAYSAPLTSNNGLLASAAGSVPAQLFENRGLPHCADQRDLEHQPGFFLSGRELNTTRSR